MIGRVVMIAASILGVAAFYFRRKQQFYKDLFSSVKNCQKYHMDYVEDMAHLPLNNNLTIYGPPVSLDNENIISSSFIKKSNEPDRLWKMKLKKGFLFNTAQNQPLHVESSGEDQILRPLSAKEYEQRAIINGVRIYAYGKIKSEGSRFSMIPQLLIGNQQQAFLTFLDKQILSLGLKSKILTGVGTALFAGHALYYHLFGTVTQVQKQMQEFKA